jgi:hypothetical protein
VVAFWSYPILNLYLICAINLAGHMDLCLEPIGIQDAFLATALRSPNIRGHKDIIVLAIIACRFLHGSIRVRAQLAALISPVRTPGTFASDHFVHRTQGWDAGGHNDNV